MLLKISVLTQNFWEYLERNCWQHNLDWGDEKVRDEANKVQVYQIDVACL